MKTILLFTSIFVLSVLADFNTSDFYPQNQAGKWIKNALKEKGIEILEIVPVKNTLQKPGSITIYQCKNLTTGKLFYSVFTQAKGRYDFFDYLVITSPEYVVQKVSVVKYRSEHGGEIASKKWLEQFEGYSTGELNYTEEISALSGATISAGSITADILKVLEILKLNTK